MSDEKKPWEKIPIEIIIEEERKRRREEERQRPRIELPVYFPHTSSYKQDEEQEVEEDIRINFKL